MLECVQGFVNYFAMSYPKGKKHCIFVAAVVQLLFDTLCLHSPEWEEHFLCQSVELTICLFVYLSIDLSIYLNI